MNTIDAISPPWSEPTFSTPSEAVEYSKLLNQKVRNDKIESCFGSTIVSADWYDAAIRIYLDNDSTIYFSCMKNTVEFAIEDETSTRHSDSSTMGDVVLIRLEKIQYVWNRGAFIQALIGKVLKNIHIGYAILFLYVADEKTLLFNCLTNRSTGKCFLHWSPTD